MGLKIKNFHASKDTVKRVKMQFIEWKQLFINHISDKVWNILYEEHIQLNNKKTNRAIQQRHRTGIDTPPRKVQKGPISA